MDRQNRKTGVRNLLLGTSPLGTALKRFLTPVSNLKSFSNRGNYLLVAVLLSGMTSVATRATAQLNTQVPEQLEEVGIDEHLDAQLPPDLPFIDSNGRAMVLGDLLKGDRPIILTMNYSNCPMLCSLQLNGLFDALEKMEWELGDQFEMITVSIDPLETPQRAQLTKKKYLKLYGRGNAWAYHCLTGKDEQIKQLAATVGFKYRYAEESKQYVHAAATMICTPDGRVSRYLYGVEYNPQTLKFALLEAGQGKIGTTVDQILMYCFHYDADSGRYGPSGFRLMQLGGVLTVFVIGGVLLVYWRRESSKHGKDATAETPTANAPSNDSQGPQ